ncbi:MAG: helix-turn-helix transcriptional regulator [Planctomycetota bacterium]|jgi:AraC-like DNA-binding protein
MLKKLEYRPRKEPIPDLPFGARSVGHYIFDEDMKEINRPRDFIQIFWGISGSGIFKRNGKEYRLSQNQIFIYYRMEQHNIKVATDNFGYRWFTIDGPLADSIVNSFGFTSEIKNAGKAPVEIFKQLEKAILDITPSGERKASALAYELLSYAADDAEQFNYPDWLKEARDILENNFSDSDFGIEQLASELKIHRSRLSREFKKHLSIPPIAYLTQLRMQKALRMLENESLKIGEVASHCGYTDPNYFCRIFKKQFGYAPSENR